MSQADRAFLEHFLIDTGPKSGRLPRDNRRVLDGVLWIVRTSAPWRCLPETFGKWGSVYRQFHRQSRASVWDEAVEALPTSGTEPNTRQTIDSTIVRARQRQKASVRQHACARRVHA